MGDQESVFGHDFPIFVFVVLVVLGEPLGKEV